MDHRYEEAREEEKLRNQREDFSEMVAEVSFWSDILQLAYLLVHWFNRSNEIDPVQAENKRKRKMQEKEGKSKKKDFKF